MPDRITDTRAAAGEGGLDVVKEIGNAKPVGNSTGTSKPPTSELGVPAALGLLPWSAMWIGDPLETVPQLQWPVSVWTFASMLNDSQIEGLLTGSTLPIRRYKWFFNPNGCDPAKVKVLAADFNLPLAGEEKAPPRGRMRKRFVHDKHLFHALKAMAFGFYYTEIVGEIRDDTLWHLTKLAPRPPLTIMDIDVDIRGELTAIRQNVTQPGSPVQPIPREQLAVYVWDQEGSNYTGRSMLRAVYRNWLIKDRLLRVDALKHERNGMGVPIAEGFPGAGKEELAALDRLAQRIKAGDTSGGSVPAGAKLTLQGVQGMLPDTVASINLHNEEMARRFLMMFMQLGSTMHGSRALGSEFIDYFQLSQESMANWYRDTTNEDVIESWWDWNYGSSDTVPLLEYERDDDPRLAFADLAQMIKEGVVRVDDELENNVRKVMELPAFKGPEREKPLPPPSPPGDGEETSPPDAPPGGVKAKRRQRATLAAYPPLPNRPLRRQLYDQEIASKVNLAQMDAMWKNAVNTLFSNWRQEVTQAQIEQLKEAIGKTSSLAKLSTVEATPAGKDMLVGAMEAMFNAGAHMAAQELADQGLQPIDVPVVGVHLPGFEARAAAIDNVAARTLGNMAAAKAVSASGGEMTKSEVADHVQGYLEDLTHSMLKDRLAGAMTTAMNTGRRAFMDIAPPATYYASEIMDENTCSECTGVDGSEYNTLADTESDYPSGGYVNCEGGDRCRGTIVAVYAEANVEPEEEEP